MPAFDLYVRTDFMDWRLFQYNMCVCVRVFCLLSNTHFPKTKSNTIFVVEWQVALTGYSRGRVRPIE